MKFTPITSKYDFRNQALTEFYPDYLRIPLGTWIRNTLWSAGIWYNNTSGVYYEENIGPDFLNNLDINLRESFPRDPEKFLHYVFDDPDRTTNIIQICLQNHANIEQSKNLEKILEKSGSAYSVFVQPYAKSYESGVAELIKRIPEPIITVSSEAINTESLIKEAWVSCYGQNPDYEKVVSRCCDILEKVWNKYFPTDSKPQIKKFVHSLKANPALLTYKGSTITKPQNILSDLAENFSDIRGQHSTGKGRKPTMSEAEFVLHYTIFVWNLERI